MNIYKRSLPNYFIDLNQNLDQLRPNVLIDSNTQATGLSGLCYPARAGGSDQNQEARAGGPRM